MARILVTGGTGTLGRLVVPLLRDADGQVRVLSRRAREAADGIEFVTGDLTTGDGVQDAVKGIEIIVNCAGTPPATGLRIPVAPEPPSAAPHPATPSPPSP